ncbi:EEF2KMT [Mytilus coruscus]|uniref:EEF2KMT n=1 Tax=Mytilus coruscus TaxID=42192 RepID=A0A6J8AQH6_MYTCO|nr:EEF2KMT [Mytilus coruscus]
MVPIRRIKWNTELITSAQIGPEEQKAVLNATVLNDLCKKYPPSVAYQKAFMKTLLHKLEESEVEMCDEIYEVYTDLLLQTEDEDDILCYKTYHLPNGETVSLQESIHLISQGTTGLNTWQAALHLAEWAFENSDLLENREVKDLHLAEWAFENSHLLENREVKDLHLAEWAFENSHLLENRKVLELGSGLGLTGIAICKQCKLRSLTFSDCHPQVLYLLMVNLEINFNSDPNSCVIKAILPENQTVTSKRRKMIRSIRRQLSVKQDIGMEQSDIMEISCTSSASADDLEEESDDDLDIGIFTPNEEFWEEGDYAESFKLCCDKRISLLQLDWSKGSHNFLDKLAPDIILAADVVYDKEVIPSLVRVLLKVLKPKKNIVPVAYIASTVRNEDTRDFFLINLANEGLAYEIVEPPKEKTFHYDDIIPIEILRIHYSGT